jgi:protein-tyrosine phosphatase
VSKSAKADLEALRDGRVPRPPQGEGGIGKVRPVKPAVLFVCLGNICRSPLAEAAFRRAAQEAGLDVEVDSAGTAAWHIGKPPDLRAQAVARAHGIDISGYRGRQVSAADFTRFTHIVALDRDNLAALTRMRPKDGVAQLSLLLDHVDGRAGEAVADPYYGSDDGFLVTWTDVTVAAAALAERIAKMA